MATKQVKQGYIKLNKTQIRRLEPLWNKAHKKAMRLYEDSYNKMLSGEYNLKGISRLSQIRKMDLRRGNAGYEKFLHEFKPSEVRVTAIGYDKLIASTKEFLEPDWEAKQVDKAISNMQKAVESVFSESFESKSKGKEKSRYLGRRLRNLSYDEMLFITTNSEYLEVQYFYIVAKESAEESWKNLLASIRMLRKRYKQLHRGK